jgi:acyl-coenzyme A thioesterase PaaI-like protein
MSKLSISQKIIGYWNTLHTKPGGKRIFSFLIGRFVPYSGTIGAIVDELRPGYARITLNDRKKVRNHLRSFHAIALANLGELTTGLAAMAGMPPKTRSILRSVNASFEKKARGLLTSTCTCELVAPKENTEYSIKAEIRDEAGDIVSVVTALWVIGPEKSA